MIGEKDGIQPSSGGVRYTFGDEAYPGLGRLDIRIPTTSTYFFTVYTQIIIVGVSFWL